MASHSSEIPMEVLAVSFTLEISSVFVTCLGLVCAYKSRMPRSCVEIVTGMLVSGLISNAFMIVAGVFSWDSAFFKKRILLVLIFSVNVTTYHMILLMLEEFSHLTGRFRGSQKSFVSLSVLAHVMSITTCAVAVSFYKSLSFLKMGSAQVVCGFLLLLLLNIYPMQQYRRVNRHMLQLKLDLSRHQFNPFADETPLPWTYVPRVFCTLYYICALPSAIKGLYNGIMHEDFHVRISPLDSVFICFYELHYHLFAFYCVYLWYRARPNQYYRYQHRAGSVSVNLLFQRVTSYQEY